ncbi:nucleotide sugar dehydrogenase [Methanogenium sp. S4BF]|uniref:nucleotide sugar dehydrogenase n=1 Tax=Methanogenium sp. S4BF TaxID=1789226 RepID=UPI0024175382|nr:nucleotide sugar dehydrogenase [Methanogenium sp. S4BF]WFN35018.1 nucleotide sugar dehydrogenase [Methanogenium sp. S4BF]
MTVKICVLGLGYIGLPTALLFAQHHNVVGVDVNEKIVQILNNGKLPFEEDGLNELFEKVKGNFRAVSEVEEADVFLIAVPTPLEEALKIADLKYVRSAAEMIASHLKAGNMVILESTVSPGASENVVFPILSQYGLNPGEFSYVHCPERAIPGKTLHEMIHNDRIVGANNPESAAFAKDIYGSFVEGNLYETTVRTAEFVKLMENTYRDVSIAIANEFARMGDEFGINIWEAISLANRHPRVNILKPGPGVGGHCIAIDPWFLTETSTKTRMVSLARSINDNMPNYVHSVVRSIVHGVQKPVITILGVAYKGNVDDWRATPALKLIRLAENEGYTVRIYDPHVTTFPYPITSLEEATKDSDCIVLVTDHDLFRDIDPSSLQMRNKNLYDTRNILDTDTWKAAGFTCKILGDGSENVSDY